MTTTVKVSATHGWPVDVTPIFTQPVGGDGPVEGLSQRVPAGETAIFYVHSHQDLRIHEVQPHETIGDHQARVIEERKDLAVKRLRLAAFITSEQAEALSDGEKMLLAAQLEVMTKYLDLLGKRLALWGIPEPRDFAEGIAAGAAEIG